MRVLEHKTINNWNEVMEGIFIDYISKEGENLNN